MENIFENETNFLKLLTGLDQHIADAQKYIKENYNIDSEYSTEDDALYIWSNNVNESMNLAAAREYVNEMLTEPMVQVIYGKRQ